MKELSFIFDISPVSQQSRGQLKNNLKAVIQKEVSKGTYLLSGDVKVEILWRVHPIHRYESHKALDIDNIIKPILDSLGGINGILIDDTQVQEVVSYWLDWEYEDKQQINITIRYMPDEIVYKKGLEFVHLGKGLCIPIQVTRMADGTNATAEMDIEFKIDLIESVSKMWGEAMWARKNGASWSSSIAVMSVQRLFHRNKITDWKITDFEAKLIELKQSQKNCSQS